MSDNPQTERTVRQRIIEAAWTVFDAHDARSCQEPAFLAAARDAFMIAKERMNLLRQQWSGDARGTEALNQADAELDHLLAALSDPAPASPGTLCRDECMETDCPSPSHPSEVTPSRTEKSSERMKVAINKCFGGFGLSEAAYEKLIEWGVPVQKYIEQERDPVTTLYKPQPLNDGEVIFDRELTPMGECSFNDHYHKFKVHSGVERYWDSWTRDSRTHPMIIRVIEELGATANGPHAKLGIVEIPDGVEYEISEYDGSEHIAETHRTWR